MRSGFRGRVWCCMCRSSWETGDHFASELWGLSLKLSGFIGCFLQGSIVWLEKLVWERFFFSLEPGPVDTLAGT